MEQARVDELRRRERDLAGELATIRAALAGTDPAAGTSNTFDDSALYGAILRSATDYALIAADLDGRIIEWNVGARDILGWSQDDIVGQNIRIIFTPEDREAGVPDAEMRTALIEGHAPDKRWHLRRDGSRLWADGRMMRLCDVKGAARGYLKILRDETSRKASDSLVSTQRSVLRTVTDTMDTAILQVDSDGRIVFVNPAAERLFGWDAADLHGRVLHETLHHHDEQGLPYAAQASPLVAVLRTGLPVRDVETVFFRKDGTPVPVTCSHTPVLVDHNLVGAVMSVQDATARKRLQEVMRAEVRRHEVLAEVQAATQAVSGDLDAVLAAVVTGALKSLPQAKGAVVDLDGEVGIRRAAEPDGFGEIGARVAVTGVSSQTATMADRPQLWNDIDAAPERDRDWAREAGIQSLFVVPIQRHGRTIGLLKAGAAQPSAFGPSDLLVGQLLAGQLATAFARIDEASALRDLRLSEERLQLALQASDTIGIWDWDLEADRCYADPRFARLFAIDPAAAAAGLPMVSFAAAIHPDDRVWVATAARKAIAEAGDYAMEHRVTLADGSVRWLSARGRSYNDEAGRPHRFPGAVVDITERKRVETSLRNAETTARLAVEAAGLGLWDYDTFADQLVWDDRCRAIFGIEASLAASLELVMSCVQPRSRERVQAAVQDAMASGRLVGRAQEFEIVRHDRGGERWVEISAQGFFAEGRCIRIIGTVADITERKQLEAALREDEQRFRTMAESIPQLAWIAEPSGDIPWFNERWFDYTGTSLEEVCGQGWQQVYRPEQIEAVVERMQAAFRDGTPWEDTVQLRGADGQFRWFLSRALPMRDEGGRVIRWFGTHTDVDDQTRARDAQARFGEDLERQVMARTEELREANARLVAEMAERQIAEDALRQSQKMEAVGQLTGGIAHDFNNLLTGITGSLDLMRKRIAQGRMGELDRYMTAAMTSANRAAALTHRLLAFARRQPLDAKPVDANALVAEMEDLFHRTLGEAIEIELSLAPDLWTTLCDPHQLENALLNLVINARDAMPDGGRLRIQTSNAEVTEADVASEPDRKAGQFVTLQVGDTGVGMAPEVIARVFEPFFTTKPIGQGTGLGLSMIYGFTRQSEGTVQIRSVVGEGSVISLFLPRFEGQPSQSAQAAAAELPLMAQGETVLVVEDDVVVRALVLDVLRELGYRTIEAPDGLTGLALLQGRVRIDLMVTDVGLPGLNGRQLAEMGRASQPHLKVLFITGYAENTAFGQGALDPSMQMITKPFAVDALAAKVRAMIKG